MRNELRELLQCPLDWVTITNHPFEGSILEADWHYAVGAMAVDPDENRASRGYEWMIGDALLATPLYGDDYATAVSRDIYLPRGKWMDYETGPILLKNYPIPVEKTPLFVGGTGIVFEQNGSNIVARIYPIDGNARTEFWPSDGKTESTIALKVRDWSKITVTDTTTHQPLPSKMSRFAAEFPLTPGIPILCSSPSKNRKTSYLTGL